MLFDLFGLRFFGGETKPTKEKFIFDPFDALLSFLSAGGLLRVPELIKAGGYIERAYKKGHPPPIWGAKSAFTPIIFRTKNPEKSRLGKVGKNFGKNLRENVSGEEKAPNLVERGQGVLKYERIIWAKIVELFVIARG